MTKDRAKTRTYSIIEPFCLKSNKKIFSDFQNSFFVDSADFSSAQLVMVIHSVVAEILQEVW